MPDSANVSIVLVEDDPGHARLVEKNLIRAQVTNDLTVLTDGQQAVDYLLRQGEYADRPLPASLVVLLDLNLPVLDGYQVLERVKADERARRIPIVILTTTSDPREVVRCYDLGCSIYVTKPLDYVSFCGAIHKLGLLFSTATMPGEEKVSFSSDQRADTP